MHEKPLNLVPQDSAIRQEIYEQDYNAERARGMHVSRRNLRIKVWLGMTRADLPPEPAVNSLRH
jgi:hypothetical protein